MTSIRPAVWPAATPSTKPAQAVDGAVRLGAQKAFFEALKGAAPTAVQEPATGGSGATGAPAQRLPRPGSLLDIRV